MLKTAILTTLAAAWLGANALAMETPKYDRKIERAAMARVAMKMGGLRETLEADAKIAARVMLDPTPTASVLVQPNEPRFPRPAPPRNFRIIAGEYN